MTFLLSLAVVVLFVLLADMRGQLRRLQQRMAEWEGRGGAPVAASREDDASPALDWNDPTPFAATRNRMSVEPAFVEREPEPIAPAAAPRLAMPEPRVLSVGGAASAAKATTAAPADSAASAAKPRAPAAPGRPWVKIGFEELFGRRLPIWAGGITLAVAGVLLVKYSIDLGLLSPAVRVALGLLFGTALIAGAEVALRQAARVRDPRVAQALAGAGVSSLYASIVAAANLYALIGPATAFVGLAAVTALAMAMALRFGAPSALLGLVGGLAAPALVQSGAPNVPLLSAYLGLTVAGLAGLSLRRRWAWLGLAAMLGGAGWSLVLIVSGALDAASTLSVGLLVVGFGFGVPLLAFAGPRAALVRTAAAVVAAAQMALLVAQGGFGLLQWGLFGLLSVALLWLVGRERTLRPAAAVGLALALLLAALWPLPLLDRFALVVAGIALLYGGAALLRLWRGDSGPLEAGQIAGAGLGCLAVGLWQFRLGDGSRDGAFALLAVLAAALPAAGAALGWSKEARRGDARFAILATATAVLLAGAAILGLPNWLLPMALAPLACGLLDLGRRAEDRRIEPAALALLAASIVALGASGRAVDELARAVGLPGGGLAGQALLRWGAVAVAGGFFAWRARLPFAGQALQVVTALLGVGLVAQALPPAWMALACGLALIALAEVQRLRDTRALLPATATTAAAMLGWALPPLGLWLGAGIGALYGSPMLVTALPALADAARSLVLPAMTTAVALVRGRALLRPYERIAVAVLTALLALPGVHTLYKQVFAIVGPNGFVRLGLAERTVWEALIVLAAAAAWRASLPRLSAALAGIAAAHMAWFTLGLHDPLWADQAVGPVPLANALTAAAAVALGALWLLERTLRASVWLARSIAVARMGMILWLALTSLRQFAVGSVFARAPVGAGESIGWSVAAIAIALGFLVWGIRARARVWRIASLVLMLAAVGKVFLVDASGLEGLLRIASFMALGFSLIGLGWLYSRFLRSDEEPAAA